MRQSPQVELVQTLGTGHASGGKEGSMFYIVEVAVDAGNLARDLSDMRTWLDHMRFQAISFRQTPHANICRVDFATESEASAFAEAFAGRMLNRTPA